jgi:PIN domain
MDLPQLRADASGERAAEALRGVGIEASNIAGVAAGRSAEQVLTSYLNWIDSAERQLGNVLEPDVVADLLYTQRFWLLRSASDQLPRLIALVLAEADNRSRVLEAAGAALRREHNRWTSSPAMLVVPDTNMFLQADAPFEAIDWPTAVESRGNVRLVLPLIIVHELDRLKRHGNNTTVRLARAALRWLAENLPPGPEGRSAKLSAGWPETTVEVYVQDGPTRPGDPDGLIIRFAQQLGRISAMQTKLVTRDLGMRLRAQNLGVAALQLAEPESAAQASANARSPKSRTTPSAVS